MYIFYYTPVEPPKPLNPLTIYTKAMCFKSLSPKLELPIYFSRFSCYDYIIRKKHAPCHRIFNMFSKHIQDQGEKRRT